MYEVNEWREQLRDELASDAQNYFKDGIKIVTNLKDTGCDAHEVAMLLLSALTVGFVAQPGGYKNAANLIEALGHELLAEAESTRERAEEFRMMEEAGVFEHLINEAREEDKDEDEAGDPESDDEQIIEVLSQFFDEDKVRAAVDEAKAGFMTPDGTRLTWARESSMTPEEFKAMTGETGQVDKVIEVVKPDHLPEELFDRIMREVARLNPTIAFAVMSA